MKKKKARRHLTIQDRMELQAYIYKNLSISEIARKMNFNKSTIQREILNNSVFKEGNGSIAPCSNKRCTHLCNQCKAATYCNRPKLYYDFKQAEEFAREKLVDSRSYTRLTDEELSLVDEITYEGIIKNKQSLHHVYIANKELKDICSEKTIRRLIYKRQLRVKCHDLRRYVRYKHEYKKTNDQVALRNLEVIIGRQYRDYLEYCDKHKSKNVVEYDSVIGSIHDKKAILTITIKDCNFQFGYLIDKGSPSDVKRKILKLFRTIGEDQVKKIFPINLSDNGVEFSYFSDIEFNDDGEQICRTYYTNPYQSWNKAHCERNHELVRYVFPKKKSFDNITQEMLDEAFSNINSYVRESLGDRTPYDIVRKKYGKEFLDAIHIRKIELKKVKLTQLI